MEKVVLAAAVLAALLGAALAVVLPRSVPVRVVTPATATAPPAEAATAPPPRTAAPAAPSTTSTGQPGTGPTASPVGATSPSTAPPIATATPTPAPRPPAVPPAAAVVYAFPVVPASAASYGRDHHDYPATDIFAACGTELVTPVGGVVDEVSTIDRWDPAVHDPDTRGGLSIALVGDDGVRHYMSHLQVLEPTLAAGVRVAAGQRLGAVGRSGNAALTPCHVHYGLSPPRGPGDTLVRRGVIWPWPYLDAWRAGDLSRSPREEVEAWAASNP